MTMQLFGTCAYCFGSAGPFLPKSAPDSSPLPIATGGDCFLRANAVGFGESGREVVFSFGASFSLIGLSAVTPFGIKFRLRAASAIEVGCGVADGAGASLGGVLRLGSVVGGREVGAGPRLVEGVVTVGFGRGGGSVKL